jgi:hypothetical protein
MLFKLEDDQLVILANNVEDAKKLKAVAVKMRPYRGSYTCAVFIKKGYGFIAIPLTRS